MNTRRMVYLLCLLLAMGLAGCSAPPPQGPPNMPEAVAAPPTAVPPTATPNVVATSEAVATVAEEEDAVATEETAAAEADASAGAADLPAEITGNLWRLDKYLNAAGELVAALESHPITAEWANGFVTGETGCNAYNGPYVRQENGTITVQQLRLTPLGMGNLGCDKDSPEVNQEGDYLGALDRSAIYTVREAGQLELSTADGELLLVFRVANK